MSWIDGVRCEPGQHSWVFSEEMLCDECGVQSEDGDATYDDRAIVKAARAYVAAQRAVPADYEWSDPRIDEMLAARDELIRVVEEA